MTCSLTVGSGGPRLDSPAQTVCSSWRWWFIPNLARFADTKMRGTQYGMAANDELSANRGVWRLSLWRLAICRWVSHDSRGAYPRVGIRPPALDSILERPR